MELHALHASTVLRVILLPVRNRTSMPISVRENIFLIASSHRCPDAPVKTGATSADSEGVRMTDEQEAEPDWEMATARAYGLLTSGSTVAPVRQPRLAKLPLDTYWAEPIQHAALRAVARYRSGIEALPVTTDELAASLARYARFIDDNRRGRARTRRRLSENNADRIADNFDATPPVDLLNEIISRDLFAKFAARLFDALDLEARKLLEAWLGEGIEFSDTQALMERLDIGDPRTVHNIKRRIRYKAQNILAELTGDRAFGDST